MSFPHVLAIWFDYELSQWWWDLTHAPIYTLWFGKRCPDVLVHAWLGGGECLSLVCPSPGVTLVRAAASIRGMPRMIQSSSGLLEVSYTWIHPRLSQFLWMSNVNSVYSMQSYNDCALLILIVHVHTIMFNLPLCKDWLSVCLPSFS